MYNVIYTIKVLSFLTSKKKAAQLATHKAGWHTGEQYWYLVVFSHVFCYTNENKNAVQNRYTANSSLTSIVF